MPIFAAGWHFGEEQDLELLIGLRHAARVAIFGIRKRQSERDCLRVEAQLERASSTSNPRSTCAIKSALRIHDAGSAA
jgi:hypothetical protein